MVRASYEAHIEMEELEHRELRRIGAERRRQRSRRRGLLSSRQADALIARGGRLAALVGVVFPLMFAVGWMFQAGQLAGYGLPLLLVTPDPVPLAFSAVTFSVMLLAAVAAIVALHGTYMRIGARWRARIFLAQLAVAFVLLVLVAIGIDITLILMAFVGLVVQPLMMAPTYTAVLTRRRAGTTLIFLLFAMPAPLGYILAADARTDAAPGDVTLTVQDELAGLRGRVVGDGCAYGGVRLVQADAGRVVVYQPAEDGVWVVPTENIVSIATGDRTLDGPPC